MLFPWTVHLIGFPSEIHTGEMKKCAGFVCQNSYTETKRGNGQLPQEKIMNWDYNWAIEIGLTQDTMVQFTSTNFKDI